MKNPLTTTKKTMLRRRDVFDEPLPEDELDPCCQKELMQQRRDASVASQLRKQDRSNKRWDIRQATVNNLKNGAWKSCECCTVSADYPLLKSLRGSVCMPLEQLAPKANEEAHPEEEENEEEDDDLDLDFMTEYELERLEEMKALSEKAIFAREVGYGKHINLCLTTSAPNTLASLRDAIFKVDGLVLHVYEPRVALSARIDLELECLSELYLGTLFRRVSISAAIELRSSPQGQQELLSRILSRPQLVCIIQGEVVACCSNLSEFGDDSELQTNALKRFLENSGVLLSIPSENAIFALCQSNHSASLRPEEEEYEGGDEENGSYCGDPNCGRKFPHEHVSGRGGTLTGASEDAGADALAKGTFYRV